MVKRNHYIPTTNLQGYEIKAYFTEEENVMTKKQKEAHDERTVDEMINEEGELLMTLRSPSFKTLQ